jgi:hypothetical protein
MEDELPGTIWCRALSASADKNCKAIVYESSRGRSLFDFHQDAEHVREMDAYRFAANNSLLSPQNSLFVRKRSLIVCLGTLLKSSCGTTASCYEIVTLRPEIAIFPVKFPVSREVAQRPVRIPLRRQPTSPGPGDFALSSAGNAHQLGVFVNPAPVSRLQI